MAKQQMGFQDSVDAGADLSSSQYCAMTFNSSGKAVLPSANGKIAGVIILENTSGNPITYQRLGRTPAKLGGAVTAGDVVKVDSSGRFVTASAADVAAGYGVGICRDGGAVNNVGEVELNAYGLGTNVTGAETVTSGDLSLVTDTSYVSVTGTVAFTLADGLYVGHRKRIECTVAATSPAGTLTINDAATGEPTSWVFNAVGQMIELEWTSAGWKLLTIRAAGSDAPDPDDTFNLLVHNHVISIDGTDDWIIPDGEVPGQRQCVIVAAAANTPVGTVSGKFYDESDGSADATDINFNAAADMAVVEWDGVRWFPITLVSATIS